MFSALFHPDMTTGDALVAMIVLGVILWLVGVAMWSGITKVTRRWE